MSRGEYAKCGPDGDHGINSWLDDFLTEGSVNGDG